MMLNLTTQHSHALTSQSYSTVFSVWCSHVERKRWATAATDILVVTIPIMISENNGSCREALENRQ
jgi:hypothetical protein